MSGAFIDNETGEVEEQTDLIKQDDSATITDDDTQTPEEETQEQVEETDLEEGDEPSDQSSQETPPTQPVQPEAPKEVAKDPGEFKPKDYSFDVTLADGKVIRIEKPEDLDKIPQDADFGSPRNFLDVQAKYAQMRLGIENDKRAYQDSQKAFEDQQEAARAQEEWVETVENELNYLEAKGKLPAVPPQYQNVDWNDPEVAKQPGVKERLALINHLTEENKARQAAGLSPMRSMLEAFNDLRIKEIETQKEETTKRNNDLRKKRGAMVGGSSAGEISSVPSDMIVGSGGSLNDY